MRFKKCSRDVLPMLKDNIVHATTHHNFYFIFFRYSSGGFLPTYNTHIPCSLRDIGSKPGRISKEADLADLFSGVRHTTPQTVTATCPDVT